ncbi:MAG: DNA polymerase III subunit beta [Rickettsiales bacterium]
MTEHSASALLKRDSEEFGEAQGDLAFSTEKKTFLRALSHIQSVVEKRTTIPVLSNVKIEAGKKGIFLTGTDMTVSVSEKLEAPVGEYGAATVSAHMLYDIVRKLPENAPVQFRHDAKEERFIVESDNCSFTLATLPVNQFPAVTFAESEYSFSLSPTEIIALIDKTRFAISTEETRYYLNGLYLHYGENEGGGAVIAVSTDGHRLAKAEVAAPEGASHFPSVIVPRKTVAEIRKIAEEQEAPIGISLAEGKIVVSYEGGKLASKLIEGNFPDYRAAIPNAGEIALQTYAAALATAIDRVTTVTSDKTRAVKIDVSGGKMIVRAQSDNSGAAAESIDVDYDGEPVSLTFNSRYLLDALSAIESDVALFHFSGATGAAPTLIRDPAFEGALFIVMPMNG